MEEVTGSYREEGFRGVEKERGIELGLGGGVAFERLREGVNKGSLEEFWGLKWAS